MRRDEIHQIPGYGGAYGRDESGASWTIVPPEAGQWRVMRRESEDAEVETVAVAESYEGALDALEQVARGAPRTIPADLTRALRVAALRLWAAHTHPDVNPGPYEHESARELRRIGGELARLGFAVDPDTRATLEAEAMARDVEEAEAAADGPDFGHPGF